MSREAYEELLMSPVGALTRFRDADGRPLCGEALITDPEFRASLELRRCPYAGSRKHHERPMNVSALKQMTRNWDEALATVKTLCGAFGPGTGQPELMRVAWAAVCLPLYLLHREAAPMQDGQVPGFVSGLHKASIDIATAVQLMLVRARSGDAPAGEGGPAGVLDFVEREGLLVGALGVCAGPPHMIHELVAAMAGTPVASVGEDVEWKVLAELGELTGLVRYVDAVLEMMAARHLIGATIRRQSDALCARADELAERSPEMSERCAQLREAVVKHPVPTRPSEIIQRQDRWLRELPAPRWTPFLDEVERAGMALTPSGARLLRVELIDRMRGQLAPLGGAAGGDSVEVRRVLQLAGAAVVKDEAAPLIAEALVASARLWQLALRFFSATETAIAEALGTPGAAPAALTQDDLCRVFGPSPARYLGELIDLEVDVSTEQILYSRRREPSRRALATTHP